VAEADPTALANVQLRDVPISALGPAPWTFNNAAEQALIDKLAARSVRLLDLPAAMSRGSSTGNDEVFMVAADCGLEAEALREPLFASDFNRYMFAPAGEWKVIFPYAIEGGGAVLRAESEIRKRWPRAYKYLKRHEAALRRRKGFTEWYGFSAPRNLETHARAQIAVPLLADRPIFAWIPEARRGGLCPMAGGGFTIAVDERAGVDPRFVLGLLNSRLLFWRLQGVSNVFRGGWITCTKQYFGELPIRTIDRMDRGEVAAHARIVALVERALGLRARRVAALDRQAAAVDAEIDREVYALYGLTPEEVALVEGGA
jgi:adenine-specific DNA-methyltransferase